MASTVLEVKNISKKYVNKTAVNQISFRVEKGQIFGILGPNGSGKTTTLSMILDIIQPSSGEYSWFEKGSHWQARKKVGALLDTPNFFPWTTVEEQLNYWSLVKGATKDSQNIQEVLNIMAESCQPNKDGKGFNSQYVKKQIEQKELKRN